MSSKKSEDVSDQAESISVTPVSKKWNSRFKNDDVSLPNSEMITLLLKIVNESVSGPVYQNTHKLLADMYLKSNEEEKAIYHLSESHAPTLRSQACSSINCKLKLQAGDPSAMQKFKEDLSFKGPWQDGFHGLKRRLSELPIDWTVVQLTLEADPLSRFPPRNRNVNRGLGMHVTYFPCGNSSAEGEQFGETENLFRVFIPALDSRELSLMTSIRMQLDKMNSKDRRDRRKTHDECNLGVEASIGEIELWLGAWHFLFLGKLMDGDLQCHIKSAVDSTISLYNSNIQVSGDEHHRLQETSHTISKKLRNLLYRCASSPYMSANKMYIAFSAFLEDKPFAKYLSNHIYNVMRTFLPRLRSSRRYPVVLVLDEDLDILPFEAIAALRDQPISRIPSIHFLHALYHYHKDTTLKKGIDVKSGFYIVDPSSNLPQFNSTFKCIQQNGLWEGLFKQEPTPDKFLDGLKNYDVFLYCGHGSGNQYIPRESIDRSCIKAVALILGCCSSKLEELGGRVEMFSISNNYLIAGSPCVVGMLWQVLDQDVNAMSEEFLKVWCGVKSDSPSQKKEEEQVLRKLSEMSLGFDKRSTRYLSEALSVAKKRAVRCMNRAAVVIRGLPVSSCFIQP